MISGPVIAIPEDTVTSNVELDVDVVRNSYRLQGLCEMVLK